MGVPLGCTGVPQGDNGGPSRVQWGISRECNGRSLGGATGDPPGAASPRAPFQPSAASPPTPSFGVPGVPTHHGRPRGPAGAAPAEPRPVRPGPAAACGGSRAGTDRARETNRAARGRACSPASFNSFGREPDAGWGSAVCSPHLQRIPRINHCGSLAAKAAACPLERASGSERASTRRCDSASPRSCKSASVQLCKPALVRAKGVCRQPSAQSCKGAHV